MKDKMISKRPSVFEKIRKTNEHGGEFWSARDMAKVLEYSEYRHFLPVIEKAKAACKNSAQPIENHFEDILEMVPLGSEAKRSIESVKLSRYACYLIVQNADPSKAIVAGGQTYFAVQTRIAEIKQMDDYNHLSTEEEKRLFLRNEVTRHNIQLADAAKDAGVINPRDYAIFQNHGYMGLYGGLDARDVHKRKGLEKSQKILDHMGSTELAANLFRTTQTEEKLCREQIKGKPKANKTHYEVGVKVRQTITELGGTMPEDLTVEEDIKKIEKKQRKQLKSKIDGDTLLPPKP